jgi:putative ABC transport system ATP-binding protein
MIARTVLRVTSAIEARGLKKEYGSTTALAGVDATVASGEMVAVMGPSGCGKSTLLHLLGGLDTPTAGEVLLDGRALSSLSHRELALVRRRHVGFVFQAFNLVPVLTVEENVGLPAAIDGRGAHERVDELLSSLGLSDHRRQLPSELSGGEQQRTAIARALVNEPVVLLADEPTGNLDRKTGAEVMSILCRLNAEGQTTLVVTHDPAIACHAGRVLLMRDGLILGEVQVPVRGDPAQLLPRLVELEA